MSVQLADGKIKVMAGTGGNSTKEAIFLTDRIVQADYLRMPFVFGKDELVEPMDPAKRVDVSKRQTPDVLKFKQEKRHAHNR